MVARWILLVLICVGIAVAGWNVDFRVPSVATDSNRAADGDAVPGSGLPAIHDVGVSFPNSVRFLPDGSNDRPLFAVAVGQGGAVGLVDVQRRSLTAAVQIGQRLEQLEWVKGGDSSRATFATVDFERHRLLILDCDPENQETPFEQVADVPVCGYPQQLAVGVQERGGKPAAVIFVGGLWSHQLTVVAADSAQKTWLAVQTLDLPFAVGDMVWDPERELLVVAAAFSPRLACISVTGSRWTLRSLWTVPDTSLRRLAISPDGQHLMASCQIVNPLAHSTRNDIHWGLMVANEIRGYSLPQLAEPPPTDPLSGDQVLVANVKIPLGGEGQGKADPGCFDFGLDAQVPRANADSKPDAGMPSHVLIEGTNELGLQRRMSEGTAEPWSYVSVGSHPVSMDQSCGVVLVACRLDHSLHVIDTRDGLNERPETTRIALAKPTGSASTGESHFYAGSLSHDNWISCNSCHVRGHTNGLLNDNLSDGSFGTPKLVISALGKSGTLPLGWNGRTETLADQVRNSIRSTMQFGAEPSEMSVAELAAYLEALAPPPSVSQARALSSEGLASWKDDSLAVAGRQLFQELNCGTCHSGPRLSSNENRDVGLRDEEGLDQFQVPSLLGVSQRTRWLHDGRAAALQEVFTVHEHQLARPLSSEEIGQLVRFLQWQ